MNQYPKLKLTYQWNFKEAATPDDCFIPLESFILSEIDSDRNQRPHIDILKLEYIICASLHIIENAVCRANKRQIISFEEILSLVESVQPFSTLVSHPSVRFALTNAIYNRWKVRPELN